MGNFEIKQNLSRFVFPERDEKIIAKKPAQLIKLNNINIDYLMQTSKIFKSGGEIKNPFMGSDPLLFEMIRNDHAKRPNELNNKDLALIHLMNERVVIGLRLDLYERNYRRGMMCISEAEQNEFLYTDESINEFIEDIELIDAQIRFILGVSSDSTITMTHSGYPCMSITLAIFPEREYAHYEVGSLPVMRFSESVKLKSTGMHGAELDSRQEASRKAYEYVFRNADDILEYKKLGAIHK